MGRRPGGGPLRRDRRTPAPLRLPTSGGHRHLGHRGARTTGPRAAVRPAPRLRLLGAGRRPAGRPRPGGRPPGAGRVGTRAPPLEEWLADLLRSAETRPVLVAHSLACGPAIRFAAAHPERLARLVLVAPAFLQAPSPWPLRSRAAAAVLRRTPPARLARLLGLPEGAVAAPFSRPGQARRAVAALRALHADRHDLRRALDGLDVPVELVAGSADPLTVAVDRPVTTIDGAGHYPQLTHPEAVAAAITVRAGKGQAAV
ncbi:alpha/beta fold hydrolase [Nonomuraea antimicrobica]